jgi:hypothetical protein
MSLPHAQSNVEVKEFAETTLATLASELTPDAFAAALERGKLLELKDVLAELEGAT